MATNTTNFNLSKPGYADTADIAVINSNMDKIDSAMNGLGTGIAIVSKNNTHAAITAGQYVYVHGHGSLADGLYTAKNNISANATLSTSNLSSATDALDTIIGRIANFEGVAIASSTNLNSLTTPGNYYSASSTITNSLSNCPVADQGFTMIVLSIGVNTKQIISSVKQLYVRSTASGSWDNWFEFAPVRMAILSNTNLNDITEPGQYYVLSSGVAATLVNSPVTSSGFVMNVYKINNNTIQQIITPSNMYNRLNAGTWYRYQGAAVS